MYVEARELGYIDKVILFLNETETPTLKFTWYKQPTGMGWKKISCEFYFNGITADLFAVVCESIILLNKQHSLVLIF